MEVKGVLRATRTNQYLNEATITETEVTTAYSAYWQSLSAAAAQDVTLPDATTLDEGFQIVVHSSGASILSVKDDTTGTVIQAVAAAAAYEFTCLDNSDADGTWFVNALEEAGDVTAERYSATFTATTEWGAAAGGLYTQTVTKVTHGIDTPIVKIYELIGTAYTETFVNTLEVLASSEADDVNFVITEAPDTRFAGRYIIM